MKWLDWLKKVFHGPEGFIKSPVRTSVMPRSETTGTTSIKKTSKDYKELMDGEEKALMRISDEIALLEKDYEIHERRYRTCLSMYTFLLNKENGNGS